ncbi:glucose-6-phosphate 1-dehydrogenase [Kribbella aluminosa]|uniref:Glucose-6-phosphate 1-dehydrogenase n=1 Tax=Kribbella aluminosa TaxID=416017 RepID=A0ABS4ULG7_9ACTN|nr:glucose-6-phosphate dehydrogenase [Kribbella aluminosa]MBP2352483.1 glucose-6-phosphate 1-dehydrogenase [Kribbella aluminosa]
MLNQRTVVIFGASGDLSSRLLLPGLGSLLAGPRATSVRIIGTGRSPLAPDEWTGRVQAAFGHDLSPAAAETLATTQYVAGDPTDPAHLRALLELAGPAPVLYFSLPPAVTTAIVQTLQGIDLPAGTELAFEKPFGTDAASAAELNKLVGTLVPEENVHRVDHFLGRTAVLNLIGLRFANRLFEPVWNAEHIESIEIVYDETLGLEGRAQYYDNAGALVDMIQSHLLLVLALLAMDAPATMDAVEVRSEMARALRSTQLYGSTPEASRRARYTAGGSVPSYADEAGVDPGRETETLAEVTVEVDTNRWAGVPITLRSGKALGVARKEIVVKFKPLRHLPSGLHGSRDGETLRIGLNPGELSLSVPALGVDGPYTMGQVFLDATLPSSPVLPYGEVLNGILRGDPLLSVRGDVAERCWEIVEPVLDAWRSGEVPLEEYEAGSDGPSHWASFAQNIDKVK